MTRDEKIKEILYDLSRLGFAGKTSGYKMLAEFSISTDAQEKFEEEMFLRMEELCDADNEPDMMKIGFFKKE